MAAPLAHLQVKRSPDGAPMARRADGKPLTPEDREEARRLAKDGFQFTIYRKGFFSAVGKLLGIQDRQDIEASQRACQELGWPRRARC